jgi:hypothetical protein
MRQNHPETQLAEEYLNFWGRHNQKAKGRNQTAFHPFFMVAYCGHAQIR